MKFLFVLVCIRVVGALSKVYNPFLTAFPKPITLYCNLATNLSITWHRHNNTLTNNTKQQIDAANNSLSVVVTESEDLGLYFCASNNQRQNINLNSKPVIETAPQRSTKGVEGGEMVLECAVSAYPLPSFYEWKREGKPLISTQLDSRIFMGVKVIGRVRTVSLLKITTTLPSDQASYSCHIFNQFGNDSINFYIRIDSKLAALWPFLGVVVQVMMVAVIILVVERRRTKVENKFE